MGGRTVKVPDQVNPAPSKIPLTPFQYTPIRPLQLKNLKTHMLKKSINNNNNRKINPKGEKQ